MRFKSEWEDQPSPVLRMRLSNWDGCFPKEVNVEWRSLSRQEVFMFENHLRIELAPAAPSHRTTSFTVFFAHPDFLDYGIQEIIRNKLESDSLVLNIDRDTHMVELWTWGDFQKLQNFAYVRAERFISKLQKDVRY